MSQRRDPTPSPRTSKSRQRSQQKLWSVTVSKGGRGARRCSGLTVSDYHIERDFTRPRRTRRGTRHFKKTSQLSAVLSLERTRKAANAGAPSAS